MYGPWQKSGSTERLIADAPQLSVNDEDYWQEWLYAIRDLPEIEPRGER